MRRPRLPSCVEELVEVGTRLLVVELLAGLGEPEPQDGEPTYAAKIDAEELHIDWTKSSTEIDRLVRLGGAWTTFRGRRLKIVAAELTSPNAAPSTDLVGDRVGGLRLVTVQPEGKAPMPFDAFARGARLAEVENSAQPQPDTRHDPEMVRTEISSPAMTNARQVAYRCLQRIDHEGAYANLLLQSELGRSKLSERDRGFVTELVYGTTRMRRACDALVDRFVIKEPQPALRTLLRLGAYQLHFAGVAAHAAVGETVELAPKPAEGSSTRSCGASMTHRWCGRTMPSG